MSGKEADSYLLEERLAAEPARKITPQQIQYLKELFRLCQGKPDETELKLKDFWRRVDEKEPEIGRWFEDSNVDFDWMSPTAWVRKLAEKQRERAA